MSEIFNIPIEETLSVEEKQKKGSFSFSHVYELYAKDLFIVKYDASKKDSQKHLEKHIDSSLVTFNIALSSPVDDDDEDENEKEVGTNETEVEEESDLSSEYATSYSEGGTRFYLSSRIVKPAKGSLIVHNSQLYHEGMKITKGQRYILVGFINIRIKDKKEEKDQQQQQQQAKEEEKVVYPLLLNENTDNEAEGSYFQRWSTSFQKKYDYYTSILFNRKFGEYSHCMRVLTYYPNDKQLFKQSIPQVYHLTEHDQQRMNYYSLQRKKEVYLRSLFLLFSSFLFAFPFSFVLHSFFLPLLLSEETPIECVNWFYPYFHAFRSIFKTLLIKPKDKQMVFKQLTLLFIAVAVMVALIALCMMLSESIKERYYSYSLQLKKVK
jgi:hypothetical protein